MNDKIFMVRNIRKYIFVILAVVSLILILGIIPIQKASHGPSLEWIHSIGRNRYDSATDHIQTHDNGYAIVGSTTSLGPRGKNIFLVKTSHNGSIEWMKAYGGPKDDFGYAVLQTDDYGYLLAGASASFDIADDFDFLVIKTNNTGEVEWYKTYGDLFDDHATAAIHTTDKGYLICGITNSSSHGNDILILNIDAYGEILWSKIYGGCGEEMIWDVNTTYDGGYIFTGSTTSNKSDDSDVWVVKIDGNGNHEWNATFGGDNDDSGQSIIQTTDKGYMICGETKSYGMGHYDLFYIKTNQNGTLQWQRTYGGKEEDSGQAIVQTNDGGYLIGGYTEQVLSYDFLLVKTDEQGYVYWKTNYSFGNDEKARSVLLTNDSNYTIAGSSQNKHGYNIVFLKTNNSNMSVHNRYPVADAGDDATALRGEQVLLDGSGIDIDGSIAMYRWDVDGDGIYEYQSTTSGQYTHIYEEPGIYHAYLEITDSNKTTSSDMKKITITSPQSTQLVLSSGQWFCITISAMLLSFCIILLYALYTKKIKQWVIHHVPFLPRNVWWYRLFVLFLLITAVKVLVSCLISSPWIYFDEPTYGIIAHEISQGKCMVMGETMLTHPYPTGYPFLLAPAYIVGTNMHITYQMMIAINSILTSLIIFPVFWIMNHFVNKKISFYTCCIVATLPAILSHNHLIMSENAFFLFFMVSCALIIKINKYQTISKHQFLFLILLGLCLRYLILIKAIGIAMFAALFFVFLYKIIKNRNLFGLTYCIPLLPSIPISVQIIIPTIQRVFFNESTSTSTKSIIGYETSQYVQRQINAATEPSLFTQFSTIFVHELTYYMVMSYIVFFLFTIFLFIYWKKISPRKKNNLFIFCLYGVISIVMLMLITTNHIYKSSFSIYSRYVSVCLPLFFMMGIIGYHVFCRSEERYKWYKAGSLLIVLIGSILLFFPTDGYKLVNNFDLIWVKSLQSISIFGNNGYMLFSVLLIILLIVTIYLMLFSVLFNKKICFTLPKLSGKYTTLGIIIVSILLFIPSLSLSLTNEDEINHRGINKPAQWLMNNDPFSTVVIEDQYAAFSGGGMITEYWSFLFADMQFWFPKGEVYVVNSTTLHRIIKANSTDIDYILSTHDLTEYFPKVEEFSMHLNAAKRQSSVDWHLYKIR